MKNLQLDDKPTEKKRKKKRKCLPLNYLIVLIFASQGYTNFQFNHVRYLFFLFLFSRRTQELPKKKFTIFLPITSDQMLAGD
jgi:hypothetical protein